MLKALPKEYFFDDRVGVSASCKSGMINEKHGFKFQIQKNLNIELQKKYDAYTKFPCTAMNKLSIKLNNCYGISTFEHTFDFTKSNANLIYAPNGVMKTSLAKTLMQISKGLEPEEKIYNKQSVYDIQVDEVPISKDEIFVVEPFNPDFEAKNISTLLVDSVKKERYDLIYKNILDSKKKLIIELNRLSGIKKDDLEDQIVRDFACSNIFEVINKLISRNTETNKYSDIKYKDIFDSKVLELLESEDVKDNIVKYSNQYNKLIEQSYLFKKGIFNPVKATSISSVLEKEKFFEARHKILLNGRRRAVKTSMTLNNVIEKEKNRILNDNNLKAISQKIITGVASVKLFQDLLEKYPEIAFELTNINGFKQVLWDSYFQKNKKLFTDLLELFENNKEELKKIEEEALLEETLWYESQKVFKERFDVPFSLEIEKHRNVILGTTAPNVVFTFEGENGEKVQFNRGQLNSLDILSIGERRAMYLLYVIFEFKARQASNKRTLIIVDDIADSFDYKNKYAIIEYLKEVTEENLFKLLVLTHNFDFYRTFQSRVLDTAKWTNSFVAHKSTNSIKLLNGGNRNISSPFDLWKSQFCGNSVMLIAMIPFTRNLIEYKDGTSSNEYGKLTSVLHIKPDTLTIKISDLEATISTVIRNTSLDPSFDKQKLVIDLIYEVADDLCSQTNLDEVCLATKVTLSIAIRLKAENYMWSNVTNQALINGTQTGKLFDRICTQNGTSGNFSETKKILGQVILMTPENIHINSFMYEPLVDISNHHLIRLYNAVKAL